MQMQHKLDAAIYRLQYGGLAHPYRGFELINYVFSLIGEESLIDLLLHTYSLVRLFFIPSFYFTTHCSYVSALLFGKLFGMVKV